MRIAAMGAGGVGGYFGARLQQAGHDVVFFARGKHLAALKQNGLTLRSPHGAAQLRVQVFERPAEAGAPVDVVMFAVKLWDTESAAELPRASQRSPASRAEREPACRQPETVNSSRVSIRSSGTRATTYRSLVGTVPIAE